MYKQILLGILFIGLFCSATCNKKTNSKVSDKAAPTKVVKGKSVAKSNQFLLAFYNVENLFDIVDDPKTIDEEYMPNSEKKWTAERYQKKLDHLYKVLHGVAIAGKSSDQVPAIIGLCEVENKAVVEDLIKKTPIEDDYEVAHFDSPDKRGIDVALMYDPDVFKPTHQEPINLTYDFLPEETTRDILYVKGTVLKTKEDLHLFVNHWSSRRGGLAASEPKRVAAATVLQGKVKSILAANPNAKILMMGDFNDEPDNKSVQEVLAAKATAKNLGNTDLYNLTYPLKLAGKGTYNYKGNWNMLDQMIVTGNFVDAPKGIKVGADAAKIFRQDWMMYDDKKKGMVPSRTYGGPNYYGGYSDHLPIFVEVKY